MNAGSLRLHNRLAFRLGLMIVIGSCLTWLVVGWFQVSRWQETLTLELTQRILIESRSLAVASSKPLLHPDPELQLHPLLTRTLNESGDIRSLIVLDNDGRIQGHPDLLRIGTVETLSPGEDIRGLPLDSGERAWVDGSEIVIALPVHHLERKIGTLVARSPRDPILAAVRDSVIRLGIVAAAGILAVLLLTLGFLSLALRPLSDLRRGLETIGGGDLTTRVPVTSRDELGLLAESINEMTAGLQVARKNSIEKARIDQELELARQIQSSLLPRSFPPVEGYELGAHYTAAREVSGDYYDVFPFPNRRLGLVVADVSGKGVPGLVIMSMLRVMLLSLSDGDSDARSILVMANRMLDGIMRSEMFITCLYGILDPQINSFRYCSAGHCPPAAWSAAGSPRLLPAGGKPIGIFPGAVFDRSLTEHEILLEEGEGILLYTDGLQEAMNKDRDQLGMDAVLAALDAGSDAAGTVDSLAAAVARHRGEYPATDDLTLLTLRRQAASARLAS